MASTGSVAGGVAASCAAKASVWHSEKSNISVAAA